ncbi:MAG: DNA sulfur modification protein DndE [Gammaproteobacteria bacterium]|nr:DNA sulfur modification protein DndE [Gammaproteobacteria bacterium]
MLPNKMRISDKAFTSLKRLQNNTGLTVNVGARLAFFVSIERGHHYSGEEIVLKQRELDKTSWLGEYGDIVEMLLRDKYPGLDRQGLYRAWGSHVDDGATIIETKKNLTALCNIL